MRGEAGIKWEVGPNNWWQVYLKNRLEVGGCPLMQVELRLRVLPHTL